MQRARQDERLDREKERLGGAYGRALEALGELAEAAGGRCLPLRGMKKPTGRL
jgi:hypothetical protein